MNEEDRKESSKIFDTHQIYMDDEKNRYQHIVNEIDAIIDNCDRQIEFTLHQLAGDESINYNADTNNDNSSQSSFLRLTQFMNEKLDLNQSNVEPITSTSVPPGTHHVRSRSDETEKAMKSMKLFEKGSKLGMNYEVHSEINQGRFGKIMLVLDKNQNNRKLVAKCSSLKRFETDIAKNECRILQLLSQPLAFDNEGFERIAHMVDSFIYENHVIIIFDRLGLNLYEHLQQGEH